MTSIKFKPDNIFKTVLDNTNQGKAYVGDNKKLYSPNGKYYLTFQTDGNLVIYTDKGSATWSSGTFGNPSAVLVLQKDGNLVIYKDNSFNSAIWSSQTFGRTNSGMFLTIDDNGIAVLYNEAPNYKPIWTSNGLSNYSNPYSSVSIESSIIPGVSNTIFWIIIGIIIALFVGGSSYIAYKNRVAIKATTDRMKAAAQARMIAMRSKQVAPTPTTATTAPINLPINPTSVQTVTPMMNMGNQMSMPMMNNQMSIPMMNNQMGNQMGMPMMNNQMGNQMMNNGQSWR